MKIICFGDSNTWGYDPRSYLGERYPKDVRWTGLLSALPGLEVINCGVNGRTIPNTPARVSAACAELGRYLPADVLLVMLGGNDLLCSPYFRAENVAERMERFLRDALPRLAPGRTLLVSPPAHAARRLGRRGAARHGVCAPGGVPIPDGGGAGPGVCGRRGLGAGPLL